MIRMKLLLALVVAVVVAACQETGDKAPAASTYDPLADALATAEQEAKKDYQPSAVFKIKVKDLMVAMTDRMLTKCIDVTSEAEMSACFHERALAGFDRDGTLRRQCKPRADFGEDFKCITFGGMGQDIRSRLIDKTVAPFDWTTPEESARLVFRHLVLEQLRTCLSSGSASDPFDCFVGRITTALDLSSSDLDPCLAYKDDDSKFGACIGESYAFKYMDAGIARM
jgi:hypothetical protein